MLKEVHSSASLLVRDIGALRSELVLQLARSRADLDELNQQSALAGQRIAASEMKMAGLEKQSEQIAATTRKFETRVVQVMNCLNDNAIVGHASRGVLLKPCYDFLGR